MDMPMVDPVDGDDADDRERRPPVFPEPSESIRNGVPMSAYGGTATWPVDAAARAPADPAEALAVVLVVAVAVLVAMRGIMASSAASAS